MTFEAWVLLSFLWHSSESQRVTLFVFSFCPKFWRFFLWWDGFTWNDIGPILLNYPFLILVVKTELILFWVFVLFLCASLLEILKKQCATTSSSSQMLLHAYVVLHSLHNWSLKPIKVSTKPISFKLSECSQSFTTRSHFEKIHFFQLTKCRGFYCSSN